MDIIWETGKVHIKYGKRLTYLNIKMNKISNEKNMATLSIVRSMTNNCLRRFGMNRTNLSILSSRNVLSTDKPELFDAPSRIND